MKDMEPVDWALGAWIVTVAAILIALGLGSNPGVVQGGTTTPASTQNAPTGQPAPSKPRTRWGNSLPAATPVQVWEQCRAHSPNPEDCTVPHGYEYVVGEGLVRVTNGRG